MKINEMYEDIQCDEVTNYGYPHDEEEFEVFC